MPKAKGRSEKTFQTEIRRSLRTLEGPKWYHKIVDAGFQNPFDAILIHNGQSYAFEYKICKQKTKVNFKTLFSKREHELQNLRRFKRSGGNAYVLCNIFNHPKWNYIMAFDIDDLPDSMMFEDFESSKGIRIDKVWR